MILEITEKDADIIYHGIINALRNLPDNEDLKELKRHLDPQLPKWITKEADGQ